MPSASRRCPHDAWRTRRRGRSRGYDTIRSYDIRYDKIMRYDTMRYDAMQYDTIRFDTADSYTYADTDRVPSHTPGRDRRDDQCWRNPSRTFSWSAYDESPARCWRPSIRLERAHQAPDQGRRAPIANRVCMGPRQLSCYMYLRLPGANVKSAKVHLSANRLS